MKNKHRIKQCLSLLLAGALTFTNVGAALPAFAEDAPATPETVSAATPETAEANVPTLNLAQITENLYDDLPDAPTGSYLGSMGLPVATGETKIGISAWVSDLYDGVDAHNTDHWKECTVVGCGVTIEGSKAAHTAGEWIIDTPATATTSGSKHKECTVCKRVLETGTIPATGSGGHTHSYGSEWKSDADKHWHECSCGDKTDAAAHTASDWITDTAATATTDGTKHKECTVCKRVLETGTIPATGSGEHTHNYSSDWKSDSINHWKECSCGDKADVAAHSFKWVVDKEATATKKGSKHEECKVCGYQRPAVEIPATGSTTKPTDPTGSNPSTGADVPQTGDNSNMILWIALLFVSGFGVRMPTKITSLYSLRLTANNLKQQRKSLRPVYIRGGDFCDLEIRRTLNALLNLMLLCRPGSNLQTQHTGGAEHGGGNLPTCTICIMGHDAVQAVEFVGIRLQKFHGAPAHNTAVGKRILLGLVPRQQPVAGIHFKTYLGISPQQGVFFSLPGTVKIQGQCFAVDFVTEIQRQDIGGAFR